jgi:hypothetical protein
VVVIFGVVGVARLHPGPDRASSTLPAAVSVATPSPAATPTPTPTPARTPTRAPGAPPDAVAVVADGPALTVFATPAGHPARARLANPNAFGVPLVLLVLTTRPGWFEVSLPIRPDGATGWVRAADVTAYTVPYQITVVQHTHTATLWNDGRLVRSFTVGTGAALSPSPDGLFFVSEVLDNRRGDPAYGPWVVGLSGFSNVYMHFAGGDAETAFHGTDEDSTVGRSASHGCFRMHNADITTLAGIVTLGTPVYVTP